MMASTIFDMAWSGWTELARMTAVGTLAYVSALLLLRLAGQQALTKMTAYGLLVTIALGSVLATALLSSQVKLDKAVGAFALLLGLQRLIAWTSARSRRIFALVNNEPVLLVREGRTLPRSMQRTNTTSDEIEAALRAHGWLRVEDVAAVILETDGSMSVIPNENQIGGAALEKLERDSRGNSD